MKKQKKIRFWTFVLSLIPGASEMYMGFMKNGISIMSVFFLSFIVPSVLRTSDVFILFAGLVWFFAFFHAGNLASCDNVTLETMEDRFIWEEYFTGFSFHIPDRVLRTWGAGIMIIYGLILLWDSFSNIVLNMLTHLLPESVMLGWVYSLFDQIPQVVVSMVIIVIGLRLIRGKREAIERQDDYAEYRKDGNDGH